SASTPTRVRRSLFASIPHVQWIAKVSERFMTGCLLTSDRPSLHPLDGRLLSFPYTAKTFLFGFTPASTHEYSAVVPLGRETLSFWISDSHGESIEPYKDDFIQTVRSLTLR